MSFVRGQMLLGDFILETDTRECSLESLASASLTFTQVPISPPPTNDKEFLKLCFTLYELSKEDFFRTTVRLSPASLGSLLSQRKTVQDVSYRKALQVLKGAATLYLYYEFWEIHLGKAPSIENISSYLFGTLTEFEHGDSPESLTVWVLLSRAKRIVYFDPTDMMEVKSPDIYKSRVGAVIEVLDEDVFISTKLSISELNYYSSILSSGKAGLNKFLKGGF